MALDLQLEIAGTLCKMFAHFASVTRQYNIWYRNKLGVNGHTMQHARMPLLLWSVE